MTADNNDLEIIKMMLKSLLNPVLFQNLSLKQYRSCLMKGNQVIMILVAVLELILQKKI